MRGYEFLKVAGLSGVAVPILLPRGTSAGRGEESATHYRVEVDSVGLVMVDRSEVAGRHLVALTSSNIYTKAKESGAIGVEQGEQVNARLPGES